MNNLIEDLKSNEPSIICAAIEALENLNPEALKANIVPLLLNNNVWVRSRAARAMCRWDRSEAIRYLGSMLFSKNSIEREVALNHSLFFPFNQIEALLLKHLTVESKSELIQKSGIVFMANPDKATAYRLYEAQQATVGLRSDLINAILMGVLNSLYQAKLDPIPPYDQLKIIKKEYEKKKITTYINHFSAMLSAEEPETRFNSALKLCVLIKQNNSEAKRIVTDYLKKETNEKIINKIKEYLESNSIHLDTKITEKKPEEKPKEKAERKIEEKTEPKQVENLQESTPQKIETAQQREQLYPTITEENFSQFIPPLLPELKTYNNSEQIILLGLIEKYGGKQESQYAIKCLDSKDEGILQAAIDSVCKTNIEALQPYLPTFIKSNSDQVKLSAIKAFALFDKTQALSKLSEMMTSIRVIQRKNALFCLENLDFASASDIYITSLKQEKNKEIRNELFSVLYDNANEEIFYDLYFQYTSAKAEEKEELKTFLEKYSDKLALQNKEKKSNDFWLEAQKRLDEENAIIEQREAYRLEKVERLRKEDDWKEKIELVKFTFICHSIGLALTLLIWFGFMAPKPWINLKEYISKNKTQQNEVTKNEKHLEIPTDPIIIKGIITDVNTQTKQAMFRENNSGKTYLLIFNKADSLPEKEKNMSAQVLVEDYENSVYTAKVLNIL